MSSTAPPDIPGLVYVQPVGSGGYADVFLYEQQMPRMNVAVKVLKIEGLTPQLRRQFSDEADTMAQLADHPYIVQVFRADTAADGRPFLVMKYYPPPNLAMRARRERFTVEEVLRTGIQLASAVETAHRAGIIHRDIKPANVLVSQYGAPGLTDFGIAGRGGAAADEDEDDVGVSVPWAPPEVLFGQTNGDERADVYALAATLWQLLVGRSPFEVPGGDNSAYALMPRIKSTPVPSTGRADVPVSLERLLAQSMAKSPDQRPASAMAFARSLQEIEQEQRFPRTAIVVLDEQGQTTVADQTGPSRGGDGDESDRTRVRAPKSVQAQSPRMPASRPAQPLSGSTEIPGAPPTTVTTPRGVGPMPGAAAAGTSAAYSGSTGDLAEEGTVRVDRNAARRAAEGSAAQEAPPEQETAEIRPGVVLGVVAALLVALVGVAVWAFAGRGAGGEEPVATQTRSTVSVTDDQPLVIPQVPEVRPVPGRGRVTFTWSYLQPQKEDTFRYRIAHKTEDLAKAREVQVKVPRISAVAGKGVQWCLQSRVIRSGVQSEWSAAKCEKAG